MDYSGNHAVDYSRNHAVDYSSAALASLPPCFEAVKVVYFKVCTPCLFYFYECFIDYIICCLENMPNGSTSHCLQTSWRQGVCDSLALHS